MIRLLFFALLSALLLVDAPIFAREAGWVPVEKWQPSAKQRESVKQYQPGKKRPVTDEAPGETVYTRQKPITEAELLEFCNLLPRFRTWGKQSGEEPTPIVNAKGEADIKYSPKAAKWLKSNNFGPARFFCIMGRMATCLFIIAEGNDLGASRPRDMPTVQEAEVALARKHLGELLAAGGTAAPIN